MCVATTDTPDNPSDNPSKTLKQIDNVLEGAAKKKVVRKRTKPLTEKQHNYNALKSVISEYLDSFIILGFDPEGNAYNMRFADSEISSIALNKYFSDYGMAMGFGNFMMDDDYDDE